MAHIAHVFFWCCSTSGTRISNLSNQQVVILVLLLIIMIIMIIVAVVIITMINLCIHSLFRDDNSLFFHHLHGSQKMHIIILDDTSHIYIIHIYIFVLHIHMSICYIFTHKRPAP